MKVIDRYVLFEFLKILGMVIGVFIGLYLIVDMFDKMDSFVKHKAGFNLIVKMYFYKMPLIVFRVTPIAVLMSVLLSLGLLSRHNEITAIKASGVPVLRIAAPILAASLVMSTLSFINNEYILPGAMGNLYNIEKSIGKGGKKKDSVFKGDTYWFKINDDIYQIKYFDHNKLTLHGITIYRVDNSFNPAVRVDSPKGEWNGKEWVLLDASIREFPENEIKTSYIKKLPSGLLEPPDFFKKEEKKAEELSYTELLEYTRKMKLQGYDASLYETDLYLKQAAPLASFLMALLGIPFAVRTGRSGGFAIGITISVIIGFTYWFIQAFTISLGHSGAVPPFIAGWSTTLLFLSTSLYFIFTTDQ